MTDVAFVIAGYGVILGSVAVYAFTLARRVAAAREASLGIRRAAEASPSPDDREG